MRPRIIPVLQLEEGRLVKTRKFKKPVYVGDPINAVRIFNDKGADELILLDIKASRLGRAPDFQRIEEIVSESFMPLAYGGGITSVEQAMTLFSIGIEKIVLGTSAFAAPGLIEEIAAKAGSQSVVVSIDVASAFIGPKHVVVKSATLPTKMSPIDYALKMVARGAGELMLTSVPKEGSMLGYDLDLIKSVADAVHVPVIAHGGAGNVEHLKKAIIEGHASAVAAGSMFVFQGPHRAVLISYPYDGRLVLDT